VETVSGGAFGIEPRYGLVRPLVTGVPSPPQIRETGEIRPTISPFRNEVECGVGITVDQKHAP
jgi:hypothetical protein